MSSIELSVLVTSFQGAERAPYFLPLIVESLDYLQVASEIVFVDNGSSDDTARVASTVASSAKVRRIWPNSGAAGGRNTAAKEACGEWLLLCDDDVEVTGHCLQRLWNARQPWTCLVPLVRDRRGLLQNAVVSRWQRGDHKFVESAEPIDVVAYPLGACLLLERELYWAVGGFDERYQPNGYEDADFGFALRRAGASVRMVRDAELTHDVHGADLTPGRSRTVEARRDEYRDRLYRTRWLFALLALRGWRRAMVLGLGPARTAYESLRVQSLGPIRGYMQAWRTLLTGWTDTATRARPDGPPTRATAFPPAAVATGVPPPLAGDPCLDIFLIHWNDPRRAIASVHSLLASEGLAPSITVIDNGSSQDAYNELVKCLPAGVRVLRSGANRGFAGGANMAIAEWNRTRPHDDESSMAIAAHDTIVLPDTLATLVMAARAAPAFGALGPTWYEHSFHETVDHTAFTAPPDAPIAPPGLVERPWLQGALLLFRGACLRDLGGFDERLFAYYEDTDICLRARRAGWKVASVNDARATESGHSGPNYRRIYLMTRNRLLLARWHSPVPRIAHVTASLFYDVCRLQLSALHWAYSSDARSQIRIRKTAEWRGLWAGLRGMTGEPPTSDSLAAPNSRIGQWQRPPPGDVWRTFVAHMPLLHKKGTDV